MKAVLNIARRPGLYYTSATLTTPRVKVYDSGGAVVDTINLVASTTASDLYLASGSSESYTFTTAGVYTLRFEHYVDPDWVVVHTDTLEVGDDITSDFALSTSVAPVFYLDDAFAGDTTSVVTARVLSDEDAIQTTDATRAAFVGDTAVDTVSVSDGDALTFNVNSLGNQTATFSVEAASHLGSGGTFTDGDSDTTAKIKVNGGSEQTITLSGASDGVANWVTSLDSQITGIDVTNSGGELLFTTGRLGSSATFDLYGFGSNFAAKTGLTAGVYTANPANNNVADSTAVTAAEVKAVIEDAVKTAVAGDRLLVSTDEDSKLVLTVTTGDKEAASELSLVSGTAALITALGLGDLGAQGSKAKAFGTNANTFRATYREDAGAYELVVDPISTAGAYWLVWYDDGVLGSVEELLAYAPKSREAVNLTIAEVDGASNAHTQTTVLVSDSDGNPVAQDVSDLSGDTTFELSPGTYTVTLKKSGLVFDRNNFSITVQNSLLTGLDNNFSISTSVFRPTFTAAATLDTCTLTATLFRFDGSPMKDTDIIISLVQGPANFSGNTSFGTAMVVTTDKNGYVEFDLVQGIVVDVAVMSHNLRRRITVPSSAGPANLMTLLSAANDVFDVVTVDIPDTPRRS